MDGIDAIESMRIHGYTGYADALGMVETDLASMAALAEVRAGRTGNITKEKLAVEVLRQLQRFITRCKEKC